MINYKLIVKQNNEGRSLRSIYNELNIPVKFSTFKRAVLRYKATGHATNFRVKSETCVIHDDLPALREISIKNILKNGATLDDINPNDHNQALRVIEDLKTKGYCIEFKDNKFILSNNVEIKPKTIINDWDGCEHFRIGVVSDTHLGSKHAQLTFLNTLYDKFKKLGISDVYHCGDIADGMYPNRSDQVYELCANGADAQVDYIVEKYPRRDGIKTHFITGNHDYTFVRNTGYNIGPAIALRRDDMEYLGMYNARVWLTPNCDIEINHPQDGSAYALSYSIQKTIDALSGGDKPKILLNGHHHKYLTMFYRNIHAIEVPTCQAQTPYMKGKRLAAHVGGLVLDIYVDEDGTIERFSVELIPLYKTIENDI